MSMRQDETASVRNFHDTRADATLELKPHGVRGGADPVLWRQRVRDGVGSDPRTGSEDVLRSTGSLPRFSASRSILLSGPNEACGWPIQRNAPEGTTVTSERTDTIAPAGRRRSQAHLIEDRRDEISHA